MSSRASDASRGICTVVFCAALLSACRQRVPQTGTPNLGGSVAAADGLVFIGGAFDRDQAEVIAAFALPDGGTR